MSGKIDNPAKYRYDGRIIAILSIWAPMVFLNIWIGRHLAGAMAYLFATLLALPVIGLIVAFGFYLAEETDEFQRNVQVQSLLWAIGTTFVVTTFWGFLELFGLAQHFNPFNVFLLFLFSKGISGALVNRRYR